MKYIIFTSFLVFSGCCDRGSDIAGSNQTVTLTTDFNQNITISFGVLVQDVKSGSELFNTCEKNDEVHTSTQEVLASSGYTFSAFARPGNGARVNVTFNNKTVEYVASNGAITVPLTDF